MRNIENQKNQGETSEQEEGFQLLIPVKLVAKVVIIILAVALLAIGGFLTWVGVCNYYCRNIVMPRELAEVRAGGDPLVAALHRYYLKHGDYPDSLAALVPEYIPFIPRVGYGSGRWEYAKSFTDYSPYQEPHYWLQVRKKSSGPGSEEGYYIEVCLSRPGELRNRWLANNSLYGIEGQSH